MTRRNLTRRQAWRIEKIQEERLRRSRQKTLAVADPDQPGGLGPETEGLVVAHYGATLAVEGPDSTPVRCVTRQNLPELVCGDRVIWQARDSDAGIIIALKPRTSLLVRAGQDERTKLVAANIDQIIVVSAPLPAWDEDMLNRYLVAAELTAIPALLLFNKIDLLGSTEQTALRASLAIYEKLGYPVLFASTRHAHGMEMLTTTLQGKTSILVGQSGVGKSSLIKTLWPERDIRIGELSERSGLGRHTTTTSMLYHLPCGGDIVDSPGVRDFGLGNVAPAELARGFREFQPFLDGCRFNDCRHDVEPGCAIRQAATTGQIDARRYTSYRRLLASLTPD